MKEFNDEVTNSDDFINQQDNELQTIMKEFEEENIIQEENMQE
jgi:hypothetical protein